MFGIGGSEIIVILVIALLFLGPDKLPDAAKTISKGIRDLKKQSRALQQQIESDEQIGGAIRDLKSALRGEDPPERPKVRKKPKLEVAEVAESTEAGVENSLLPAGDEAEAHERDDGEHDHDESDKPAGPTLPEMAGEADMDVANGRIEEDDEDLGKLIKPASGAIAKADVAAKPAAAKPAATKPAADKPADPTKSHG